MMFFGEKTKEDKEEHEELVKSIIKSTFTSTYVVLTCVIIFELFFYINCVNHAAHFGWIGKWYRLCYMSLLVISGISMGLVIYCSKDYDHRYWIVKWLSPVYCVSITVWALSITYLDCLKSVKCSPIIIMTILLCIPACVYVNPNFFITLNIMANVVMLCMLIWAPGGGDSADIYNFLVFMIIQTIVGRFFLTTKYSYFKSAQKVRKSEKKLVQSNEELKLLNEEIKTQMQLQMELKIKEEKLAQQKRQAEEMTMLLVKTLTDTIEAKDEYTRGHSVRVSEYAALIAEKMELPEEEVARIKYAATLHDIGKIGVPDTVLNKPSRLTDEEYEIIKTHSTIGADILQKVEVISYTADIARHHHERYDGKGYPDGLVGEENSIGARIVAVADAFDAMNSRRIYRKSLDQKTIIDEMNRNKGSQFDPGAVEALIELQDEGQLEQIAAMEKETVKKGPFNETYDMGAKKVFTAVINNLNSRENENSKESLTGLLNREDAETKIAEMMKKTPGAVIFCDMDNLKSINEHFGHKSGDKVLRILGEIIGTYGAMGVACRIGGDEFLLYLDDVNEEKAVRTVETLNAEFKSVIEDDSSINIAAVSAGIYLTKPTDIYSEALSKADKALYHIKQNGKGEYYVYREEMKSVQVDNHADINQVTNFIREAGKYDGALGVEYRQFARMFDHQQKVCRRYGYKCKIVLITLDTKNNSTMYIDSIEQGMKYMEKAIKSKIRNVDIYTRYSSVQFVLILLQSGNDNVDMIMNRIFTAFYKMNSESDFVPRYEVNELFGEDKE